MTYRRSATILLNTWNLFQAFDAESQEEITGSSAFDIAVLLDVSRAARIQLSDSCVL